MAKRKRRSYSAEFKREAVELVSEQGYSVAEAARNLKLLNLDTRCRMRRENFD